MNTHVIEFLEGPAQDIAIYLYGEEVFATSQISYIHQSPSTLSDGSAAIVLDASYWWFDSGRTPEILRIERDADSVHLIGSSRFEQIPGDSKVLIASIPFTDWLDAVRGLLLRKQEAEQAVHGNTH
jgi:hypothetical protein